MNFRTGFPDFCLPDLRGTFLRGADLNAGLDPDIGDRTAQAVNGNTGKGFDTVGSRQADQLMTHTHDVTANILGENSDFNVSGGGSTSITPARCASTGGSETRPKNVYVYYLILGDLPAPTATA